MILFSRMLPQFTMGIAPIGPHTSIGGLGNQGTGGGGSGGGSSSASSTASSVLALHDVAKPLGHVLQLGEPARAELANTGRNQAVNSSRPAGFGVVRKTSPRGQGSNNTPIAFYGGGAKEGRGGPSAGG